jgi:hypothetical protein
MGAASRSARIVIELLRAALDSGYPYDVAVLDSILPGLNGMELSSVIREDARFNMLKLMLLSLHR